MVPVGHNMVWTCCKTYPGRCWSGTASCFRYFLPSNSTHWHGLKWWLHTNARLNFAARSVQYNNQFFRLVSSIPPPGTECKSVDLTQFRMLHLGAIVATDLKITTKDENWDDMWHSFFDNPTSHFDNNCMLLSWQIHHPDWSIDRSIIIRSEDLTVSPAAAHHLPASFSLCTDFSLILWKNNTIRIFEGTKDARCYQLGTETTQTGAVTGKQCVSNNCRPSPI